MNKQFAGLVLGFWLTAVLAAPYAVHAKDDLAPGPGLAPALSQDEAVKRTLDRHPALNAAALEIDIEHTRREAEAQPPPLEFEAGAEDLAVRARYRASTVPSYIAILASTGTRRQGDTSLRCRYRRVEQALVVEKPQLSSSLAKLPPVLEVVVLQERYHSPGKWCAIAGRTLEFVTARVKAGGSARAEASWHASELSRAELAVLGVDTRLDAARMALANMWEASPPDFGRAGADIYRLPGLPSYASLEQRLTDNPALLQRAAELNVLQAQSQLANARQEADVSVSGGVKHLAATDDVGFVVSVSVPFGSASRAKPSIAEFELLSEQTPLLVESQTIELRTMLSAALQRAPVRRPGRRSPSGGHHSRGRDGRSPVRGYIPDRQQHVTRANPGPKGTAGFAGRTGRRRR